MYEVCIRLSYGVYTRHFSLLCMHVMHCTQYDNTTSSATVQTHRTLRTRFPDWTLGWHYINVLTGFIMQKFINMFRRQRARNEVFSLSVHWSAIVKALDDTIGVFTLTSENNLVNWLIHNLPHDVRFIRPFANKLQCWAMKKAKRHSNWTAPVPPPFQRCRLKTLFQRQKKPLD